MKGSAPTSTQSALLKSVPPGHKKTPVGVNRPGSLAGASLEGSIFEPSEKLFQGRLRHRFPTIRGERITTVKRDMRRYEVHTGQARATVRIDVGIRLPAPFGGG